jgi:CBS domain containing-hemolysin-like protein
VSEALLTALVLLIGFATSFLLSGMEAGVSALNRLRIRHLDREGQASARVLGRFLRRPENFLWTILVGNTLANVILLGITYHLLHQALRDHPVALLAAMGLTALALYMFADLLPKTLFRRFPTRLCLALARPFAGIHLLLRPAVWVIERCADTVLAVTGGREHSGRLFGSREELRQALQDSAQSLTGDELAMVNRVLDMQTVTVGAVAIPLGRVVCVAAGAPLAEAYRLCRETGHDRLPVRKADGLGIAGLVTLRSTLYRDPLDPATPVAHVLQPALYLEDHVPLESALKQFQRGGQRLAVVLDRNRREVGILTLTDILRFVFGEVTL